MIKKIQDIKKEVNFKNLTVEEIKEKLGGTKVHAIAVQKGGTGKTTASSDLAYTLAKKGFKVLLIDSDPQASLSSLCNVDTINDDVKGLQDIYEYALMNKGRINLDEIKNIWVGKEPVYVKPIRESGKYVNKEVKFGFDLIPANINLANCDIALANDNRGALMLYSVVCRIKEEMDYDYILIDTCPGLSTIAYNAITAAVDGVIVPINLEPMTIKGAQNLINVTTEIQHLLDRLGVVHKGIAGIIKNQYAPRLNIQKRFSNIVETFWPIPTFEASIPNKTSCDTAHDLGRLYSEYDPKVGQIYEELVDEIIALDIYRANEKEPIYVEEFGEEIWNMINENNGKGDEK